MATDPITKPDEETTNGTKRVIDLGEKDAKISESNKTNEDTNGNNGTNSIYKKMKTSSHSSKVSREMDNNNLPREANSKKQLSFYHENDEDDEVESHESSRASPIVNKVNEDSAVKSSVGDVAGVSKITEDNAQGCGSTNGIGGERKVAVKLDSDQEDASTTTSCSCEEHSSVAGANSDNEQHEDLDYDDDSVTDSPPRVSRSAETNGYHGLSKAHDHKTRADSEEPDDRIRSPVNIGTKNDKEGNLNDRPEANGIATSPKAANTRARIKSVINFNHLRKKAAAVTTMNPDEDDLDNTSDDESRAKRAAKRKKDKDRSKKSYENLLKYFFKDACYFQIKSINHENVEISKSMGVWSTLVQNEVRLNAAFREHRNVILIFSVAQSGHFQGFARMISESQQVAQPVPWVFPPRSGNVPLGGVLQVEWLCTKELSFQETRDMFNPWNGNKPVKVARDGQQVEPEVGQRLCSLFPRDSKRRLLASIDTLKLQTSQRKKMMRHKEAYYPLMPGPRGYHPRNQQGDHRVPVATMDPYFLHHDPRYLNGGHPHHHHMRLGPPPATADYHRLAYGPPSGPMSLPPYHHGQPHGRSSAQLGGGGGRRGRGAFQAPPAELVASTSINQDLPLRYSRGYMNYIDPYATGASRPPHHHMQPTTVAAHHNGDGYISPGSPSFESQHHHDPTLIAPYGGIHGAAETYRHHPYQRSSRR